MITIIITKIFKDIFIEKNKKKNNQRMKKIKQKVRRGGFDPYPIVK